MSFVILGLLILATLFGPQLWARAVLRHYRQPREDFPGNGGELARHLIKQLRLDGVQVEISKSGDHYDPLSKTVRLDAENFEGKSLTAVVVAAHEVGHALQDQLGYKPLRARLRLALIAERAEKLGAGLMLAIPIITLLTRAPVAGFLTFLGGLLTLGTPVIIHLLTLPVEWDASFKRALPVLIEGGYLERKDQAAARRILTACALTYVAASLASLLNLARWIALLRR